MRLPQKCTVMVRFNGRGRGSVMDRVGHLSVLRLVLPMVVLAASMASVQAGSAQAPAPVRAVVARPAPPMMQAPRQAGAVPATNLQGTRINAPPPNAAPAFSPRFQMGGQTTPAMSGSGVGAPPLQAGRFNFAAPPGSGGLGGSSNTTAPASVPSPPARVVFTPAPPSPTTINPPVEKFSTAGPTTPMVQAPQQPTRITIAPAPNSQSTSAPNSIPLPTRITLTPIQPQQNQIATPALSASVAGPTTPMVQSSQPTRITIASPSNPQSSSAPNSEGYNSGAGMPIAPGINSRPGITASGYNSAPGISTGPGIASGTGIRSGGGIPVESSLNSGSGLRSLPAASATTYDSGPGIRVGPGLAARSYNSGSGITSRQIEAASLPPIATSKQITSPIAPTGSSGITASTTTNRPVSADATNASGGVFSQLYASIKSTLHPTALFTVETIRGSEKSVAVDTLRGLPDATKTVVGAIGNAAIASEKAAGQDIAAAIGAPSYQQQIMQTRASEVSQFNQLINKRDAERAAGQDTSKLDAQVKNFKYTPDDTSTVFPAVKKTNGQVVGDFAGLALDATTGGSLGGEAKAVKGVGTAANVVRESSVVGGDTAKAVQATRATEATSQIATRVDSANVRVTAQTGVLRPSVSDAKLNNIVHDLYKGTQNPGRIGTGSTADAIRSEMKTGQPTSGKFHTQKGQEYARALERWMANNPNASPSDRTAAQLMANDLKSALAGN